MILRSVSSGCCSSCGRSSELFEDVISHDLLCFQCSIDRFFSPDGSISSEAAIGGIRMLCKLKECDPKFYCEHYPGCLSLDYCPMEDPEHDDDISRMIPDVLGEEDCFRCPIPIRLKSA